jgi:hypothetical protein
MGELWPFYIYSIGNIMCNLVMNQSEKAIVKYDIIPTRSRRRKPASNHDQRQMARSGTQSK